MKKKEVKQEEEALVGMFEVLGLWTMSTDFLGNLDGMLNEREIIRTVTELGRK